MARRGGARECVATSAYTVLLVSVLVRTLLGSRKSCRKSGQTSTPEMAAGAKG